MMKRLHGSYRLALVSCLFTLVSLATGTALAGQRKPGDTKAEAKDQAKKRVFSGPQVGEKVVPFKVLGVKAGKAKELKIVKKTNGTTLICFLHKLGNDDRILFGLPLVDFYAKRHKNLTSHFVLLTDDRPKVMPMLRRWSRTPLFTKSLVSVSVDGAEGPGSYGLNRKVTMTVLVAKKGKVVSNLVINAPNRRDLEKIMGLVAKALGKPQPKLAKVLQELRAERKRRRDKRIKGSPVFKLAPNEQLGRMMFGMVHARGNRSRVAKRLSQRLVKWAGKDEKRKATLKKYCRAVLDGDFKLNQYSRAALKKLAGS